MGQITNSQSRAGCGLKAEACAPLTYNIRQHFCWLWSYAFTKTVLWQAKFLHLHKQSSTELWLHKQIHRQIYT